MPKEAPTGTVTLMFSDIEGSTRLLQRLGDSYADVLATHRDLFRDACSRHDGFEVDEQGDAYFVVFASAHDAVAAAAHVQRALTTHAWPEGHEIRVRIGLHTGEPDFVDGRYVGLDVHRGARVMAAGHGGQVLVSESTHALLDEQVRLRDLGEHRLKDLAEPQHLYQLEIDGLPAEFPPLNTLENRPTNLPAPTSTFIGRERELAEVESLLVRPDLRLLTLTGPGGAGKTRLALQVGVGHDRALLERRLLRLARTVRDAELVVPAVARALGLREYPGEPMLETLTDYVRDKELLLVLDNLEQVLAAAPAIAGLLASASGLRVLATSRVPLNLSGESTYAVPPLALPDSQRLTAVADLERSEAVRLFVDRAHAAAADFALTPESAEAVAEICRRLDGLPLAIELAAPRVRVLTPAALLRRLDQRLSLLTGGAQDLDERQRTLRGTIEWSYELLLEDEKALFARLALSSAAAVSRRPNRCATSAVLSAPASSTASARWWTRAFCDGRPIRTASRASGCSRRSASSRSRCCRPPARPTRRGGATRAGTQKRRSDSMSSRGSATGKTALPVSTTTTRTSARPSASPAIPATAS